MLPLSRRRMLAAAGGLSAGLLCPRCLARAAAADEASATRENFRPEPTRAGAELITADAQRAIQRALRYLAGKQIRAGRGRGCFGTQRYSGGVAVCALSGLAFMSSGSPPGRGPYGKNVDMCVDFIVASTQDSGFIAPLGGHSNDQMYGHGLAMLFLAEVYGMTQRNDIGRTLRKAVALTCRCQNDEGGWRYQPVKSNADLSITICQIMALRAARDAGLKVPIEVRNKCMKYVRKCQNSDGGYRYTLSSGSRSTVALTAAGVVSLYSAGVYEGREIERAIAWLEKYPTGKRSGSRGVGRNYYYGQYYAAQAMWQIGGDHWTNWYTKIRDKFIREQAADGSWTDPSIGPEFGTAIALIILNTPNNFLPIFAK